MLVVVSDLHMTDRATGASVTDAELTQFVQEVTALQPQQEPITLLLLGDIVDLLRSERWDELWTNHAGAGPWSGTGKAFVGFEGNYQEATLLEIIKGIEAKYTGFFAALGAFKKARNARIVYVAGNHDFMLQVSGKAREQIVRLFAVDHAADKPLPMEYLDPALDLYADHGHRHDEVNFHQWHSGRWALGDAIVLRVVNRFAALARELLKVAPTTPLGRLVDEIDNVEPDAHIPFYVAWLESMLASEADQRRLRDAWRSTVTDFLQLPEFREDRYEGAATTIRWTRTLYGLVDLNAILKHLEKIPISLRRVGHVQQGYTVKTLASVRVFGHTHAPGISPLPSVNGKRWSYVNTGAWRSHVSKVSVGAALDFGSQRVSAMLVVRGPGEFELIRRSRCP